MSTRVREKLVFSVLGVFGLATLAFCILTPGSRGQEALVGPGLILFSEPGFQGLSLVVNQTLPDLPVARDSEGREFDWNDNVRSAIVLGGTWRLHQHGRCNTELDDTPLERLDLPTKPRVRGWTCLLSATREGPLELSGPEHGGWGEDVSSVELVSERNLPDWVAP
jgi:hypothetical protein